MEPHDGPQPETPPEAQTAQEVQPAPAVVHDSTEVIDPQPSFAWEASEFVHHDKPALWYLGFWVFIAVVCGGLALLHQWLSIVVVVVMALAVLMYSRKEPRVLAYALDEKGVSINGKLSPYTHFRSYNVQQEIGWEEIDLEPTKRLGSRVTLLADDDSLRQIEAILRHYLPRVDRDPDVVERLSRYLKF